MSDPELQPASYEETSEGGFGPRIPWKWILIIGGLIAALIVVAQLGQAREISSLRARIVEVHETQIAPLSARALEFRERLEGLVMEAATSDMTTEVDSRFRFSAIHNAQVIYLRIPAEAAESAESIREAALAAGSDSIGACLGVAPLSLRGMYESDAPLRANWIEEVNAAEDRRRLESLDYQIGQHVQRDLPLLMTMVQSHLFMLVLERGATRREHPVDFFLWDLRRDELLVRARARSRGRLLSVRVRTEDGTAIQERRGGNTTGAVDCSIAQQLRRAAGEGMVEVRNTPPDPAERDRLIAEANEPEPPPTEGEPQTDGAETEPPQTAGTETEPPQAEPRP
jgi:hypothetical protein